MLAERERQAGSFSVKALQVDRKLGAHRARRGLLSSVSPGGGEGSGRSSWSPIDPPELPGRRLAPRPHAPRRDLRQRPRDGRGHASPYFDDWVSFPFVPGHEVVGRASTDGTPRRDRAGARPRRTRRPAPRSPTPRRRRQRLRHLATGHLEPASRSASATRTCGGWAPQFVAHDSQLHDVPDAMSDEQAVLVEPLAARHPRRAR